MPAIAVPVTDDIFAKCIPNYSLGTKMCTGLTLTELSPTTVDEWTAIYTDESGKWRLMGALIESDFIGRSCQTRQNTLWDWISQTARAWDSKRLSISGVDRGIREVAPYVKMGRKGIINNNYWSVTNGAAGGGTSPNNSSTYTHHFDLTSQTGIPPGDVGEQSGWFTNKIPIYIRGKNTGSGVVTTTEWEILDSDVLNDTTVRVYCIDKNTASFLSSGHLQVPITGLAMRGTPRVSDYESYCAQVPGINPNQQALFWIDSTRWTLCVDEEMEKLMAMIRDNNPLYKQYGDVPSVELNRQILEDFQNRLVNQFFWGKPLPNQTAELWKNLDLIKTPDGAIVTDFFDLPDTLGRNMGRRAAAVGMYEQLAECSRIKDLGGLALNIPELLGELYLIWRTRMDNRVDASVIELVTSTSYAPLLRQGFFNYMQSKYNGAMRINFDGSDILKPKRLPGGFTFSEIDVDYPAGVTVRIVTSLAFDDLLDAHVRAASGLEDAGRWVLILDIGNSMYMSVLESNTVTNSSGDLSVLSQLNQTLLCTMKVPKKKQTMKSMKYTFVNECPGASLWIEGIANQVPEHCAPVGDVTDLAGSLSD